MVVIKTVSETTVEATIAHMQRAGYHGMNGKCPMRRSTGRPVCQNAFIFSQNGGESAGMAINGNSMTIWNPADVGCLTFVDEDGFSSGHFWQITSNAKIKQLSDQRAKQNIYTFRTQNILEKISEVKVVTFKYRYDNVQNG